MNPLRVVIAIRRTLYRQAIVELLRAEESLTVVGEAMDVQEALAVCERLAPDVALIDADLFMSSDQPNMLDSIHAWSPQTVAVVMGASDDTGDTAQTTAAAESERLRALSCGAIGYVRPVVDRCELVRALVCAGDTVRGVAAGESLGNSTRGSVPRTRLRHDVTERERDVLALVADGRCNKEIAQRLGISTQTVKNHVSHLLEKYALQDRTQLAIHAIEAHIVERRPTASDR